MSCGAANERDELHLSEENMMREQLGRKLMLFA